MVTMSKGSFRDNRAAFSGEKHWIMERNISDSKTHQLANVYKIARFKPFKIKSTLQQKA